MDRVGKLFRELDGKRISRRQLLQGMAAAATAAALPVRSEAAAFKGTWVNQYTYVAPDLNKTVDWYVEVFGMQRGHTDAKQVHLWYGDTGGDTLMIVRQAEAGEIAPRIDKFGFTIADWDRTAVEAELRRLGRRPQSDTEKGFWFDDLDGNEIGLFAADYVERPSASSAAPMLWKAVSANHIVILTEDYEAMAVWYKDLLDLRQTRNSGRDTYLWLSDSVWIPTMVREDGMTSAALGTLDHVAYSIETFEKESVEAELQRRNLKPVLDAEYSFNCVDINGFKTQVCDKELVVFAEQRPPRGGR